MGDGENLSRVDVSVFVEALDIHLVLKRSNLELVEQSCLTGTNLVTFVNDLDGVNDFYLGLNNLGLDV